MLNKRISEDARLSWASRGLLVFLLGKPDHWEVSTHHLINQTESCLGKPSGRDAVRGLIKELEIAGYLRVSLARAEGGEFGGRSYTVSESPATDYPGPVEPSPANPPLVSIEVKQGLKKAVRTEKPSVTEGFEQFYRLYPKKVGLKAAKAAWTKLSPGEDLHTTLIAALGNHCISESWTKDNGRYVPNPATWLNGEKWHDILPPAAKAASNYRNLPDHTDDMYQGAANGNPAF